jgi:hypothetical protein
VSIEVLASVGRAGGKRDNLFYTLPLLRLKLPPPRRVIER